MPGARCQTRAGLLIVTLVFAATVVAGAQTRKQFQFAVSSGASVSVINEYGAVTVRPAVGGQVIVSAILYSPKVEVNDTRSTNRVQLRTHLLQPANAQEGRVDYDVQVPAHCNVVLRSATGPISVTGIEGGDVTAEGDTAQIEVRDGGNGHVHLRTVNGPITVANISGGHVEITSVSGDVTLERVTGPYVSASGNTGLIRYTGDFGGEGEYSLTNHAGDIEIALPASASVEISARSVKGTVENNFPFEPKDDSAASTRQGKSFTGKVSAGASSVRLRTFSGDIRVKKQ